MPTLPETSPRPALGCPHFPARFQALIFRNWGVVPCARIARALGCSPAEARAAAEALGLDPTVDAAPCWDARGYQTIIRNNWHLCPFDQLLQLLDMPEERLAFLLKEDDFLWHKLGMLKPLCERVRYRALAPEEAARTRAIAQTVRSLRTRENGFDFVAALSGPAQPVSREADDGRLRVVTTLFPYYDFARAVAGDRADVTLLLSPGREAHSFEPTPLDAVTISRADVFIYNGGEGEVWADDMLDAVGEDIGTVLRMMDFVDAREEEFSEGMQGADSHDHAHGHGHDHDEPDAHDHEFHDHAEHDHDDSDEIEYDEHIWTSPKNAIRLCRAVADALCAADAENADLYRANCEDYCAQLEALDADLRALRASAVRDLLVFADRFPFLYFCEEYDLHYRAAFHGCSGDTEPSLATLKYLIDKVNDEHIPVVYTIDLSSQKVAEAVSECTGARIGRLWSMQTVSRTDFDAGETYLTLMQRNYEALKGGLL